MGDSDHLEGEDIAGGPDQVDYVLVCGADHTLSVNLWEG